MGASVKSAIQSAMSSMIGIYAKENASVAERRKQNSMNGTVANVLVAARQEIRDMIGTTANAISVARKTIIGLKGSVLCATRKGNYLVLCVASPTQALIGIIKHKQKKVS